MVEERMMSDAGGFQAIRFQTVRFQTVDALPQRLKRSGECGDFSLELDDSLCSGGVGGGGFEPVRVVVVRNGKVRRISEEMGVSGLARAGLARENRGKRTGALIASLTVNLIAGVVGGVPGGEALERRLDRAEVVEGVEAVRAAAKFAWSLGAAQHQEAEDRGLVAAKVEDGADAVLVLGNSCVADGGDKSEIFKAVESLTDLLFGKVEYGIAAGALVARVHQGVERERVVFRCRNLFFDEGAEDAELVSRELHDYKGATGEQN
jgi:hypothetical protein